MKINKSTAFTLKNTKKKEPPKPFWFKWSEKNIYRDSHQKQLSFLDLLKIFSNNSCESLFRNYWLSFL